jgi:hypothetical protein
MTGSEVDVRASGGRVAKRTMYVFDACVGEGLKPLERQLLL